MAGYHITEIAKGVFGEVSKIIEEARELEDAHRQGAVVMELVELSDLVGAIKGYLHNRFGDSVTLSDLERFANITFRAFESGYRR